MMGSIVRIPAVSVSSDRLDARYNAPEAVNTRVLIERCGIEVRELGRLFKDLVCGPFGSTLTADQHSEDGEILLAQPTNISSFLFDDAKSWRISRRTLIASGLPLYQAGTLLFARVGIYPHVGMLTASVGDATISSSMIAGTASGDVDHAYLLALLRSKIGQSLLFAAQKVTAQPTIGTYEIGATRVPVPNPLAQRYIGDKVRQAGRLRELASRLVGNVRDHHARLIPEFRPTRVKWNTFRIDSGALDDVLVPHFYPPAVTEYLTGQHTRSIGQLCQTVYSGETYDSDDQGVDQATSRSCSGRFIRRPCNQIRPPSQTDLDLQQHDLLLTNAAHDKGYIGKDITYYHGGPRNIPSAKVMVLRPNRYIVSASYVFVYLQTPIGYLQVQSAIRGISAGIRAQDVASIRIPLPTLTEEEHREWMAIDEKMADAGIAEETANLLCAVSTLIVERLIEGRFSEADLIAAQEALDAGDRSADREILKALRQSDAPGAQPLFADVDGLYTLLEDSEGQDP